MNREEFESMSFDELASKLCCDENNVHSYESLKEFAVCMIKEDNLFLAAHVLENIDDGAEYYDYDCSMGTMEYPTPIWDKDDLVDYVDE